MPTGLGISKARNWRIGVGDERLNTRTAMNCAWMLDGATKDRVYGLSLASRVYMRWEPYEWIGPEGRDDERNDVFESTPPSRFHKLLRIESIRLVTEPIRFHSDFKFNVQNALKIDSPSSESILKRRNFVFKGRVMMIEVVTSHRTIGSSKCLWGSCFHVGQELTSRLTVAAGGPPASVPATNLDERSFTIGGGKNGPLGKYERWLSSASSGSVGLAMITDRGRRFIRTVNPWVGDSHSVKSFAACLGELEVSVCRLGFSLGQLVNLSFAGSVVSASKLIRHVRDLVDRFWGVTTPPKGNLRYIRYQLAVWQTNQQFQVQLTFGGGVAWSSCLSSRLPRVTRCHRYNPAVTRTSCALVKYGASDLRPELTNFIGSQLSPGQTYCHQVPKHLCHAAVANLVRSRNCHYASRGVGRIALRD
ncbi:hypothetical protein PIB30_087030 [Stylosanthes scabra]|uniref:Uncharacterized protein n=1 Tax=Stylosanthes scabra TaxID=79078 RepID=A0ABU6WRN9_9FABA|nr:hypothetical protein [Stylosanthes scabra]